MSLRFLSIACLTVHLFIAQSSVVLYKKEFPEGVGRKYLELKCDFDLIEQDYVVKKVMISKNGHVFYSVNYSKNNRMDLVNPVKKYSKLNGQPVHGMSKATLLKDEGWAAIRVKNHVPGSYKCLVHFSKTNSSGYEEMLIRESDNVAIVKDGEQVKMRIDRHSAQLGDNVKLGCEYKLVSNDSFYGLSLFKDDQEFFKYYNDNNHTFEPIDGVRNITWSSYARAIYMTVEKAVNTTGGMYGCAINYSSPHMEDPLATLTDQSRLEIRSASGRVGFDFFWLILNLFVIVC